MKEIKAKYQFEKDTKRFHRFQVISEDEGTKISGTIYLPKDSDGIPKRIVLENAKLEDK